jgi:hypothetical protein
MDGRNAQIPVIPPTARGTGRNDTVWTAEIVKEIKKIQALLSFPGARL